MHQFISGPQTLSNGEQVNNGLSGVHIMHPMKETAWMLPGELQTPPSSKSYTRLSHRSRDTAGTHGDVG